MFCTVLSRKQEAVVEQKAREGIELAIANFPAILYNFLRVYKSYIIARRRLIHMVV